MDFYVDLNRDSEFRKKHGAHFTPVKVVKEMCAKARGMLGDIDLTTFKFLDLASGTGVFSYYFAELLSEEFDVPFTDIINNNCVMMEKDKEFINKCVEIYTGLGCRPNIVIGDALFNDYKPHGFDLVLSNPPYVRIQELNKHYRRKLQAEYQVCSTGSSDLYYAFMQLGLEALKNSGVFAFITPSSYLRTDSGGCIRGLISNSLVEVKDFGSKKLFSCGTYTAITYAIKDTDIFNPTEDFFWYKYSSRRFKRQKSELKGKLMVGNTKGTALGNICSISGGIATLRDKIFIIKPDSIDNDYVYIDGTKLEKASLLKFVKISKVKDHSDVKNSPYWCIYPYKGGLAARESFVDEQEFRSMYPNTFDYLLSHKAELLKRDRGVYKGYKWFEFGRSQGLKEYVGWCIVTSTMNTRPLFIKTSLENCLVGSGLVLNDINYDMGDLLQQLNSEDMANFIDINGAKFSGGWRGYNKRILSRFNVVNKAY